MRIGIIGAGNIATAILSGISSTDKNVNICCSDVDQEQLSKIKKSKQISTTRNNLVAVTKSDLVFLCVKPNVIEKVMREIKPIFQPKQILISVAVGVPLKTLESFLGKERKIIRTMPNLPCLVARGVIGMKANKNCTAKDKKIAEKLISSVGKIVQVRSVKAFDYLTAICGSGPAFLAEYIRANMSFAKSKRLGEKTSKDLVFETISGTIEFLKYNDIKIEKFISMVASPGGTTEEGLKSLRRNNYTKIVKESLRVAAKRSSAISKKVASKRKKING